MEIHTPPVVSSCELLGVTDITAAVNCSLRFPSHVNASSSHASALPSPTSNDGFYLLDVHSDILATLRKWYWEIPSIYLDDLRFPDLILRILRGLQLREYEAMPAWKTWAILESDNFTRKAFVNLPRVACILYNSVFKPMAVLM
ncbi:unnamed protein product [Dibothriocephalus latus]|uniref:Uncharacterized protein n=1 Tax=Dibothriocephalus latus TaxID=60516 RepID=A0A3P7N670_DIBLA|nr:unnamed protein product [Dibothriocephalus latus]